jgi:hypothetical protein
MPYSSVAASEEVEVYDYWALIMVRMMHGSTRNRFVDDRSEQATSGRSRTKIYSSGFVVHTSIVEREAIHSFIATLLPFWMILKWQPAIDLPTHQWPE